MIEVSKTLGEEMMMWEGPTSVFRGLVDARAERDNLLKENAGLKEVIAGLIASIDDSVDSLSISRNVLVNKLHAILPNREEVEEG
jgi:hypothetical protein